MELYPALKAVHMGLAVVSIAWLMSRGIFVIHTGRQPGYRALRVAPHIVDTLLLVSGIWLAVMVGWSPGQHPWLATKLVLLVAYIAIAWLALKPWLARPWRWSLLLLACSVFGWMLTVAISKSPWGPLSWLGW